MKANHPSVLHSKYRELLIAIALFLVIDLGVLVFSYQSSRMLEADTNRINLASDLRVYSQQLAKAVLTLRQESINEEPIQTSIAQISEAFGAFNTAITALQGDLGKTKRELFDNQGQIEKANSLLADVTKNWEPLSFTIKPLVSELIGPQVPDIGMKNNIDIAANKVVARNIRLMQQADDLTKHLESMAVNRAGQMQTVQLTGIILAFLNFVFIAFKFLRRLIRSDREAAEAREEVNWILGSVREGLFLLGRDGNVGAQQSASTGVLLGSRLSPGSNLYAYLAQRVNSGTVKAAENYISTLFNGQIKPSVLKQLNPLRKVEFKAENGKRRYLDFEFQQVNTGTQVKYLLVSVSDITERILLSKELAGAQASIKVSGESLLEALCRNPVAVSSFVDETNEKLRETNGAIQKVSPSNQGYRELIKRVFHEAHDIQNQSSTLGLFSIKEAARTFKNILTDLQAGENPSGNDLIPVALAMDELQEEINRVRRLISRLSEFSSRKEQENKVLQPNLAEARG